MAGVVKHANKVAEESISVMEGSNVSFPPLMATLDAYVDGSSDLRYAQTVEKVVKTNGKKKAGRKVVKKKATSHNLTPLHMEENYPQPESQYISNSVDNLREQYHLRRYSASEREDYIFGSMSLESAPPRQSDEAQRRVHISSPPLTDRKAGQKGAFAPKSPARVLVQSPTGGAYAHAGAVHLSPTDSHSPGSQQVVKTDLGFNKAVDALASIKLHNYAMKRREHTTQKLKLMREIRSFDLENNAELHQAQKSRRDEVLAAWKLRYYIEYLRLQTLKHVVDVVEKKNIEMEEECGLLQQTSAVAEIENESLTKEIARLRDSLQVTETARAKLQDQLQDVQCQLELAERQAKSGEATAAQAKELFALSKQACAQEHERVVALESELSITRQTCQDLVRACAKKETEVADMNSELQQLRALHQAEQAEILLAREVHLQELEHAKMREEDNEIRYRKANDLYAVLNDREKTIRHLETEAAEMQAQIFALKTDAKQSSAAITVEKEAVSTLQQEKAGLQKLLSELARRLTQADEEAIKHSVIERQHKADAKTAQAVINEHLATIAELEEQAAAAQNEIEFLVEENHELAREIECHHMFGEEMMTRYLHTHTTAERNLEYSRFLEEELFCARKLYEKTSTEYVEGSAKRGGAGDRFDDVSEESYGYRTGRGANAGEEGGEGAGAAAERPRSFIESWTGLEPVAPLVVHLNSFSKGARRSSKSRNEFDRPSSASLYNPESRPNSTNAPNNSLVAEQRLLMVLAQLEEKMRSVDRAADSLRFLAEKADAIEKVQATTANILTTHATAAAIARQPVRLSEMNAASAKMAEEKQAHIEGHINMERVFSEMHASLDQVNAQLAAQQQEVVVLQERKAECKNIISGMKKLIKKSRKASTKDPEAVFLTEQQEGETTSEMAKLSEEMEALKERINAYKSDNLDLNSKSIALQTELYHLDQNLEKSAADFFNMYGEHITNYYPAELAHLIENAEGHMEEHGHYTLPSPTRQLNTLYEEDEWSESVAREGSNESVGDLVETPKASFDVVPTDGSSLEGSDLEAPFSEDSPSYSTKSKKHRKASKMDVSGEDDREKRDRKASKMGKLARKASKLQKLAKKHRKASALDANSETDGSVYDTGAVLELEEGSSGLVEESVVGGSKGSQDQLPHQKAVVLDTNVPSKLHIPGAALTPHKPHLQSAAPLGPHSPTRVGRLNSGETSVDRQARLQVQQARERLAQLRVDLERTIAQLDTSLDELEVVETRRVQVREEIVAWVDHFHSLCGYYPEVSDKLRSTTLAPSLERFTAAQTQLQELHARAVGFYSEAHRLRNALVFEQHQQAAAIPVEQLEEQMHVLYPICEFSALVLEDPLHIPYIAVEEPVTEAAVTEGENANQLDPELMQQMARALAVFGGDDAIPAAQTVAPVLQDPPSLYAATTTTMVTAAALHEMPAKEPVVQPIVTASADVHDEATFQDHIDSAPQSAPQSADISPITPLTNALATLAESDLRSISTWSEMSLKMTKSIKLDSLFASSHETPEMLIAENKRLRKELRVWTNDYQRLYGHKPSPTDFDSFDEIVKAKLFRKNQISVLLEAAIRDGRISAEVVEGMSVKGRGGAYADGDMSDTTLSAAEQDVSYSVPTTPYRAELVIARPDLTSLPAEYVGNYAQSAQWAGMFADSAEETTAALQAEFERIARELRVWSKSFETKHGRRPSPELFHMFPADVQERIHRKDQLRSILSARPTGDPAAPSTAVKSETSPVPKIKKVASKRTKGTSSPRQSAPESDSEVSTAAPSAPTQRGKSPKSPKRPGSSPRKTGKPKSAGAEQGDSDSAQSFPTTPFAERMVGLDGQQSISSSDFSVRFAGKSAKWASMYPDPVDESPEALLAEQRDLKNKLRAWAQNFLKEHGRKPLPEEYDTFDEDVKRMIFRKNQLKIHFASVSADAPERKDVKTEAAVISTMAAQVTPVPHQPAATEKARTPKSRQTRPKKPTADAVEALPAVNPAPDPASLPTTPFGLGSKLEDDDSVAVDDLLREYDELRAAIRTWTAAYVRQHGKKPSADAFVTFEPEMQAKLLRKNQVKKLLEDRGAAVTAESQKYPDSSDNESARPKSRGPAQKQKSKPGVTAVPEETPAEGVTQPPVQPTGPVAMVLQPEAELPLQAEGASPERDSASASKKKGKRTKSGLPPSGDLAERDAPSTAMSTSSAYSVPTTPFADSLAAEGGDGSMGGYGADMSVRITPAATGAQWQQTDAAVPSEGASVAQLEEELKSLKKELRRWNTGFVRTHGRNPGAEDFELFGDEVKAMLFRKNQVKERLDLLLQQQAVADTSSAAPTLQEQQVGSTPSVGANVDAPAQQSASAERPSRKSKKRSSLATAADTTASPQPQPAVLSATPTPAHQVASADSGAGSLDELIAQTVRELNEVKQALKQWQKEFTELNGRDPQRTDLTPEVVAWGERRDVLKQVLIENDRADLASSKSAKRTPTAPSPETPGGLSISERVASPKYKKVTFTAAGDASDSDSLPSFVSPAVDTGNAALQRLPTVSEVASVVSVEETVSSFETGAVAVSGVTDPALSSLSTAELNAEYSRVKKALKQWQREFEETHGREPEEEDFDGLDDVFKDLVVRKYEIKALLSERGEELAAGQSSKSKKSKKSSKSHKHASSGFSSD